MYQDQGQFEEATELILQVVEIKKRQLGEVDGNPLALMEILGSACRDQGRLKKAEELTLQVVEIRKRVLGEKHPETLDSLQDLAVIYMAQDRL